MDCQETRKFLQAYLDGEFDDKESALISAHLTECQQCRELAGFEKHFRARLRASAPMVTAPVSLVARVRQARPGRSLNESWSSRWVWRLIPAAAAVILILAVGVSRQLELAPQYSLAEQSVQWHRQQLPMDVAGPSFDAVRQYFSDKVPFAVHPPRFNEQLAKQPLKTNLVGARLSHLREHRAAYLTYQVGGQRVSVFIFDPQTMPLRGQIKHVAGRDIYWQGLHGYNVAMFEDEGLGFAVASDMDTEHLVQLLSLPR